MARKSGLIPMWTDKDVHAFFSHFQERAGEKIYLLLQRTGEEFVRIARLKGNYKDQTGNLRSSIGYVIALDGKIVGNNFKISANGSERNKGKSTGEQLAMDLVKTYSKGWVLIGLAGMKYAIYVEAMENKDVITLASTKAEEFIKKQSENLFKRIEE